MIADREEIPLQVQGKEIKEREAAFCVAITIIILYYNKSETVSRKLKQGSKHM